MTTGRYNGSMRLRLFVLVLALLPSVALADDAASVTQPSGVSASTLGPTTAGNGSSSSADSATLQPAGTTPLQSTTGDASGLNPVSSSPLQAGASDDPQLK